MSARSIGGNYWDNFTTNNWIRGDDGIYTMTISNDVHALGYVCHFHLVRLDNGVYKSAAVHYEINSSGDITVYSKEAFTGIYYIVSGA